MIAWNLDHLENIQVHLKEQGRGRNPHKIAVAASHSQEEPLLAVGRDHDDN
jgi:hypothetical protein